MARVAQHPADQPHISKLCEAPRRSVALIKDILRLDVEPELGGGIDVFGDRRIHPVQTIEQEDLIGLKFNRFCGGASAFLKTINGLLPAVPLISLRIFTY